MKLSIDELKDIQEIAFDKGISTEKMVQKREAEIINLKTDIYKFCTEINTLKEIIKSYELTHASGRAVPRRNDPIPEPEGSAAPRGR